MPIIQFIVLTCVTAITLTTATTYYLSQHFNPINLLTNFIPKLPQKPEIYYDATTRDEIMKAINAGIKLPKNLENYFPFDNNKTNSDMFNNSNQQNFAGHNPNKYNNNYNFNFNDKTESWWDKNWFYVGVGVILILVTVSIGNVLYRQWIIIEKNKLATKLLYNKKITRAHKHFQEGAIVNNRMYAKMIDDLREKHLKDQLELMKLNDTIKINDNQHKKELEELILKAKISDVNENIISRETIIKDKLITNKNDISKTVENYNTFLKIIKIKFDQNLDFKLTKYKGIFLSDIGIKSLIKNNILNITNNLIRNKPKSIKKNITNFFILGAGISALSKNNLNQDLKNWIIDFLNEETIPEFYKYVLYKSYNPEINDKITINNLYNIELEDFLSEKFKNRVVNSNQGTFDLGQIDINSEIVKLEQIYSILI